MAGTRFVVEVNNLRKSFKGKRVLDGIDLTVAFGEFVAIVGRSGSGKSTLLNIIGLLDEADAGSIVRLFGKPAPRLYSVEARDLLRTRLAYIFQNAALIDQDTVEENLKIAQRYSDKPRGYASALRKIALKNVGLEGMEKQKVFQLSGGEQQRLALACVQMHPSEVILADEPTGSLDPENRDIVMDIIDTFKEQGRSIIMVTHDRHVADRADKVVRLDRSTCE